MEIGESCLAVGRMLLEQWNFGGICRETDECFVVRIPDKKATLMSEIQENAEERLTLLLNS